MNWTELFNVASALASDVTNKYGQPAWELMLNVYRIDAVAFLLPLLIAVFCVALLFLITYKRFMNWTGDFVDKSGAIFFRFLYIVGFTAWFIAPFYHLCDVWRWVEMFYPQLYIAKQILVKVTGG